ncbi:MAG: SPASM domain-containing protein [Synergistaceae bacterium]|jgi:radical SAM protein with 4Fe4S-binding SPASM domain|nr:SPASM domain-containing protein [Synergistaceae bacterium]
MSFLRREPKRRQEEDAFDGLLRQLAPFVDVMTINSYSPEPKLPDNIARIAREAPGDWALSQYDLDLTIQMRYAGEVLSNRGMTAPNNRTPRHFNVPCYYPFTDLSIIPDGEVALCCADLNAANHLGNAARSSLSEIWQGERATEIRSAIRTGRENHPFCVGCDFLPLSIHHDICAAALRAQR